MCSVSISTACTLVPSDGHSWSQHAQLSPPRQCLGSAQFWCHCSLDLPFTTMVVMVLNEIWWRECDECELVKPGRGVSCMVEERRTHSACGVGHWDGSYSQIAHGLHAPLKERFRDVWKDPATGQAAVLLCSAFLEAGKWLCFILVLLAQYSLIPANTALITYQTSNKMWLSGPRWRHGALLLSCKPSVKMA